MFNYLIYKPGSQQYGVDIKGRIFSKGDHTAFVKNPSELKRGGVADPQEFALYDVVTSDQDIPKAEFMQWYWVAVNKRFEQVSAVDLAKLKSAEEALAQTLQDKNDAIKQVRLAFVSASSLSDLTTLEKEIICGLKNPQNLTKAEWSALGVQINA